MDQNDTIRKVTHISDSTGVSLIMIRYVVSTIVDALKESKNLDAIQIVRTFISNLIETQQSVEKTLESHGIHSSLDLGNVIMALCDDGLLSAEESDSIEAFDNIFTTSEIEQYIKEEGLKKRKVLSFWIGSVLLGIGIVILITSYKELLPKEIGFWGWILGLAGCLLIYIGNLSKKKKLSINYP